MELRDYQALGVDLAVKWRSSAEPGDKLLLASPTGTGKSVVELAIQDRLPDCWIVTPMLEIVAGLMEKRGAKVADLPEHLLIEAAWLCRITTPMRLKNRMMAGFVSSPLSTFVFDEAHHDLADTYQDLQLLSGFCPCVGLTATPFRGSPRVTARFLESWGEPTWLITFAEAAQRGVLSVPACSTLPLVDDDLVEVRDGELVATQVEAATQSKLCDLTRHLLLCVDRDGWNKPTVVAVPSRAIGRELADRMMGLVRFVDGSTPYAERQRAFQLCVDRRVAVVQVNVVSEGVDFPFRRLVDVSPCLSPVKWLQRLGRVTRPGGGAEYVCCNRNLMRHGYLLEGCVPERAFLEQQEAFGPSKRAASRALGLESLGQLKGVELPLKSGIVATCYSIADMKGHVRTDYFVIVHPVRAYPLWAKKISPKAEDGSRAYGRWLLCDPPSDLSGFSSVPPKAVSDKQKAWWERSASHFGLDAGAEVNRKTFQALPVLADLGVVL